MILSARIADCINYALTTDIGDDEDVIALVDEVAALVEPLDETGWTRHAERVEALNADLARGLDATPRAAALKALTEGLVAIRASVMATSVGAWPSPEF